MKSYDFHPMCVFLTILNKVFITFVASNTFARIFVLIFMWQSIPDERWPRSGAASTGCFRLVGDVKLLQESSLQQGHHSMVTMWVVRPSCISNFSPQASQSNICRFGNSSLSSLIGDSTGLDFTFSELLIIFWKLFIFVSFPLVYLHTSFRFETVSTNVTLVDTSTGTGFCLFSGRPPCAWHFSRG